MKKQARDLAQINKEYYSACAKLGEAEHQLKVDFPDALRNLQSTVTRLEKQITALKKEGRDAAPPPAKTAPVTEAQPNA